MRYTAKGVHNRHFELFDDKENLIGRLDYTSWFSIKSELQLPTGEKYEIGNANSWHTILHMTKGNTEICTMKYNWKGQIIINMIGGATYMLKPKGFFHSTFVLITEHEQDIITLHPNFEWSKLSFNYMIDTNEQYTEGKDAKMILLALYCTNHMKHQHSAAM